MDYLGPGLKRRFQLSISLSASCRKRRRDLSCRSALTAPAVPIETDPSGFAPTVSAVACNCRRLENSQRPIQPGAALEVSSNAGLGSAFALRRVGPGFSPDQ